MDAYMTKEERNIIDLLKKINDNLISLNSKMDNFIQTQEPEEKSISLEGIPLDVATLLSLPDHLRKTAILE